MARRKRKHSRRRLSSHKVIPHDEQRRLAPSEAHIIRIGQAADMRARVDIAPARAVPSKKPPIGSGGQRARWTGLAKENALLVNGITIEAHDAAAPGPSLDEQ